MRSLKIWSAYWFLENIRSQNILVDALWSRASSFQIFLYKLLTFFLIISLLYQCEILNVNQICALLSVTYRLTMFTPLSIAFCVTYYLFCSYVLKLCSKSFHQHGKSQVTLSLLLNALSIVYTLKDSRTPIVDYGSEDGLDRRSSKCLRSAVLNGRICIIHSAAHIGLISSWFSHLVMLFPETSFLCFIY